MKTKLLRKLRKRYSILFENGYYYPVNNDSLHWNNTYPYYYTRCKNFKDALSERRKLILKFVQSKRPSVKPKELKT